MRTAGKLVRSSFFRNAELIIVLGVNFFMAPFIVRALGNRMYGFWTLVGTFLGYYGLLDFGLSSAAARYVARALGKADRRDLGLVVNTAFFLFSLLGLGALAVTLLSAAACPLFVSDPRDVALMREMVLLLGAATAIGFPLRIYWGILTAYIRFDAIAYISIARTALSNAAIYVWLAHGHGIMSVAVITFAATMLQNAATYAVCKAQFPDLRIEGLRFDRSKVRELFDHSWKTFVCSVSDIVRVRLDNFVIAGFLNVSLVTPYSIGSSIASGVSQLVLSSMGMMQPVFSRYEGRGDYAAIRGALLLVTRLSAILTAFLGLSIMFYAPAFIRRWMGPGFEGSAWVAAILCAGSIIWLPQSPGVQLLYGLSKHEAYAVMTTCEAVANLLLSLLFLKRFGMYGVALGTTVEIVVFKLLVQPVYICRAVGLPVRVYLIDTIGGTLLKSSAALGVYFYLIRGLVLPDYARLCACAAVETLLFAPTAYFLLINGEEQDLIKEVLRSLLWRKAAAGPEELDALA